MKKAIIVAGPSGSGKGTLCQHLLAANTKLKLSVSATTRLARPQEQDGVDYYFWETNTFLEAKDEGLFLEYEEVYPGRWYGTLNHVVEEIWQEEKIALFDVDVDGALRLKRKLGDNALSIFIEPHSIDALRVQLKKRNTESDEQIDIRIARAPHEIAQKHLFDKIVRNHDLWQAKIEIVKIVENFLAK
jgi:guanylate kinase